MKTDISPEAVTRRLRWTSELRKLCVSLGKSKTITISKRSSLKTSDRMAVLSEYNSPLTPDEPVENDTKLEEAEQ